MATRRSTRQASRDPESATPASPSKARGRPPRNAASAATAAAAIEANHQSDSHLAAVAHHAVSDPSLQPIPEDGGHSYQPAQQALYNNQMPFDPNLPVQEAVSAYNDGAVTQESGPQGPHLGNFLPELDMRSKTLLRKILPPKMNEVKMHEVTEALVHGVTNNGFAPPASQTLSNHRQNFNASRGYFLTREQHQREHDQLYIDVNAVVEGSVVESARGPGPWRPDAVLQRANLTSLAVYLLLMTQRGPSEPEFQSLEDQFPAPFLSDMIKAKGRPGKGFPGLSKLFDPTFQMLLAIRTQAVISHLALMRGPNFNGHDPAHVVNATFRNEDNSNFKPAPGKIRWLSRGSTGFTPEQEAALSQRHQELLSAVQDNDIDIAALEHHFPWTAFRLQAIEWMQKRDDELKEQITGAIDVDAIAEAWEARSNWQPSGTAAAPIGSRPEASRRNKRSAPEEDYQPEVDGEVRAHSVAKGKQARGDVVRDRPVSQHVLLAREQFEQVHEHPRWIDAQPGAQKVTFESQASPMPSSKRQRMNDDATDMDPSQDAGFETDQRPSAAANQRRLENVAQVAQENQLVGTEISPATQTPTQLPSNVNVDVNPRSSASQALSRTIPYSEVSRRSKAITISSGSTPGRSVPQQRKQWTNEEIEALIDLIGTYKNGYAQMKKADMTGENLLRDRDAEALRHKARNMKFDYLKAGVRLPEGFDCVLLDKKFRVKLAQMGIPYEQDQARRTPGTKNEGGDESAMPEEDD